MAQINKGKVELDVDLTQSRIKEIEIIKKTQPELFTKDMQSDLSSLNNKLHNYQRSQEMSRTLSNAGIVDTVDNNQMIVDNLLEAAKKVEIGNTEIVSYLSGPNGIVQVTSRWMILDDGPPPI